MTRRDIDTRGRQRGRIIRSALTGGGLATLAFLGTSLALGSVGNREALVLLESTLPTIRFLCTAAIGAAATILALMLTLLGLSQDMEAKVHPDYFARVHHIATMCVWAMVGGVTLLVILFVPLSESENLVTWYTVIYYTILSLASLLGGGLVAITLTLRQAVKELVAAADPEGDSNMLLDTDEDESEE